MRIKQSFVTNSSSSSFVAFGRGIEKDQIYKNIPLLQAIREMYIEKGDKNEQLDELLQSLIEGKDPNRERPKFLRAYDIGFDTYLDNKNSLLVYHESHENDDFYLGISPYAMEMDETRGQVYEKIVKEFTDFLFINITSDDISYIEEAWVDN